MKEITELRLEEWMKTELGLDGNELIVYAIIHQYPQDNNVSLTDFINYVISWTGVSEPTIRRIFRCLEKRSLITRHEEKFYKSITRAYYTANYSK